MIRFEEANEPVQGVWRVEYYDEGTMFPVGTVYLVIVDNQTAQLNFILVADQWRGRGIADKLFAACKDRWPNLFATSAMHEDGDPMKGTIERLLRKYTNYFDGQDSEE